MMLIYYLGHSGISINEKTDRLAVEDSSVTSRIAISFSDVFIIILSRGKPKYLIIVEAKR